MSVLKYSDVKKMNQVESKAKLAELKFELVKAHVTANKTNAKTKEIKKAISRIITFGKSVKASDFAKVSKSTKMSGVARKEKK
jgi:ribosomal protein L17